MSLPEEFLDPGILFSSGMIESYQFTFRKVSRMKLFSMLAARILLLVAVLLPAGLAQNTPAVPDSLKAPADQHLILLGHASGDQIYKCQASANGFAWTFSAPEAKLVDDSGKEVAKHFVGPSWQSPDGSQVKGKVASQSAPDPDSVPWLLLNVVEHNGTGIMSQVQTIQRLNTKGGKAPATGCDAQHQDELRRVGYTADYYFYAAAK